MSTPQYEVAYRWQRSDKSGWHTIGHAFMEEDGRINVHLTAAPLITLAVAEGTMTLFPKKDKPK